jgi:cytochrome c biogenesis protein CcmG/thiol:disulfide interchange protein DsbE
MNDLGVKLVLTLCAMAGASASAWQEVPAADKVAADTSAAEEVDSPEGKAVLVACAEAIEQARAITYEGYYHAVGGMLEGMLGTQRGTVKMLRTPVGDEPAGPEDRFVCLIIGTDIDRTKHESRIDVGTTHGTIEWINHSEHKVLERPTNDAQTRNKIVQSSKFLRCDEFFKTQPLNDLDQVTATLGPQETVDGVACDVVTLIRGHARKERWYIAATDHLPRRIAIVPAGDKGELVLDLSGMTVDNSETPSLTAAQMRVQVPPGYEEDRRQPSAVRRAAPAPTPGVQIDKEGAAQTPPTPSAPPAPPALVMAPEFELSVGRGAKGEAASGSIKLADLRGSVVVLDFFGTWTIAAPEWHAELDAIAAEEAYQNVKLFALNVRERVPENAVAYMDREKHTPTLLMNADDVARAYGVHVYPATVVIDKAGKIVKFVQGARAGGEAGRAIRDALAASLGSTPASSTDGAVTPADAKAPQGEVPAEPK